MGARPTHQEEHFTASELVRDLVIGMSDGLTVPFALAAGLAGAVSNHWLIVIAGASEIAAGSIAMGLGGYLAARGDADLYAANWPANSAKSWSCPIANGRRSKIFSLAMD